MRVPRLTVFYRFLAGARLSWIFACHLLEIWTSDGGRDPGMDREARVLRCDAVAMSARYVLCVHDNAP